MNIFSRKSAAMCFTMAWMLALCAPAQSVSSPEEGDAEAPAVVFHPMFLVGKGAGSFTVTRPGGNAEPGVVGHAYPFGSRIAVQDGEGAKVMVFLAHNEAIRLGQGCDAAIEDDPENAGAKRILLHAGRLETSFTKDDKAVLPVSIVAPCAVFDDIDGRVTVSAAKAPSSTTVTVSVTDGKVSVHAPQLKPSRLGNSAGLVIETRTDESFTMIEGLGGDYKLYLENGNEADYEAAFHTGSRIKIWRSRATLSKLLAVSILITNVDGAVADSYAFNEGQAPIKNGVATVKEDADADAEAEADAEADGQTGLGDDFGSPAQSTGTAEATDDAGWDFNF